MKHVLIAALAGIALATSPAPAQNEPVVIIPRTETAPLLDGLLTDACWSNAVSLAGWSKPESTSAPAQYTEAQACFDDNALYLSFTCRVTAPAKLIAIQTEKDIWRDDCVEAWIRSTSDSTENDHFTVNSISAKELIRKRFANTANLPENPAWQARSAAGTDRWTCEIAIPFRDLGRTTAPAAGESFELKLGREDYAASAIKDVAECAVWPAGVKYTDIDGFHSVFFGKMNLLDNADLNQQEKGVPTSWEMSGSIQSTLQDGTQMIILNAASNPCRMEQSIKLAGGQMYRLSADIKGDIGGRLRGKSASGESQIIDLSANKNWTKYEIGFLNRTAGRWSFILETPATGGQGTLYARSLMLVRNSTEESTGPAIAIPVDAGQPYGVTHIPVTDCRALRGFFGAPVDGTVDSPDYSFRRWEYNFNGQQADAGTRYVYRNNDGLHITLADKAGVNAVQIRGGVAADMSIGCKQYDQPESGQKIHTFPGKAKNSLFLSKDRILSDRFSFFNVQDGYIADASFFRTGDELAAAGTPTTALAIGGQTDDNPLKDFIALRFDREQTTYQAGSAAVATNTMLALNKDKTIHIIAGPFDTDIYLSGIGITGAAGDFTGKSRLTVQVQDHLQPRLAITTVMLELDGPGKMDLALNIPDQVLPKGKMLWLTLIPGKDMTLSAPGLVLYTAAPEKVIPEALAFRLLRLKTIWLPLSESRPWTQFNRQTDIDEWLASIKNKTERILLTEIRTAIDHCVKIAPDDPVAQQYYNWFYRGKIRPELPPASLPVAQAAPEWAVVARAAWLESRSVPEWWVANRVVATGEFGGWDDDGSMYQNFGNFPMFEQDGVGGALKQSALSRAELDQTLRLDQGLNKTSQDPLHAYEEGLNQESLACWWHYADPVLVERAMLSAKNMESLTMTNAAGHRHFKGDIIGATFLRTPATQPISFDSGFSAQLLHPACEVALYNRNPRAMQFLKEIGDAWVDHMAKGKPGEYPLGVDAATDTPVDSTPEPFSGGFGCHASLMTFLARVTGDSKYIQPMVDFFTQGGYGEFTGNYLPDLFQLGLLDHAPAVFEKQMATSPSLEWLKTGNKDPFLNDLKHDISEMQTFRHMYTTAEPFTDRIFLYAAVNPARAYTGGYSTRNKSYHSHTVSWAGFGTNYAAMVRTGRRDQFHAIVYNFNAEPTTGSMRFWMLDHGRYEMTVGVDTNSDDLADHIGKPRQIEIIRGEPVSIMLAPQAVTVIKLTLKEKLDPIELRADLALSPSEIVVKQGGIVEGVVHNIGSKKASKVIIALVDAQGEIQEKKSLGKLAAPLDLTAKRIPFKLEGLPENHAGWRVVVDPKNKIPEITELNNAVMPP